MKITNAVAGRAEPQTAMYREKVRYVCRNVNPPRDSRTAAKLSPFAWPEYTQSQIANADFNVRDV